MLCNSLAAKLFSSSSNIGERRKFHGSRLHSPPRMAGGPRMEALEDRRLLAVTVGNDTDVVNAPDLTSIAALVANDGGDGISLREAVVAANNTAGANVINFAPAVQGTISLTNGQLDITDDLTIHGPGKGKLTVSGSGQSRVFDVIDSSLAVDQLTIADGHAVYDGSPGDGGGGIRANGAVVTLENVVLENNRFEGGEKSNITGGGAIKANASNISLDHVTARNNEAADLVAIGLGGAISTDSSSLHVSHSDFEVNRIVDASDTWGGAIGSRGGQTVISHSTFNGNQADGGNDGRARGGAVMSTTGGSLDVDNSRFTGNSAVGETGQGGAIVAFQGITSTISNSQFVHNSAEGDTAQGGAIWNSRGFGGAMTIDISSIINNWVSGNSLAQGGGVFNGGDLGGTTMTIDTCSIVNNRVNSDVVAQGGGIYNGESIIIPEFGLGPATLTLTHTNVNANRADGVGDDANGVGGGVYNRPMNSVSLVKSSNIHGNKASTSHDDVFGDLELLSDLLFPI